MSMGDFYPLMALEAELKHVREQKQYLEHLEARGPVAIRQEIEHLERREARVAAEIADEEKMLEQTYNGYE